MPTQKTLSRLVEVDPLLDAKVKEIIAQRNRITITGCEWYTVHVTDPDKEQEINIFHAPEVNVESLVEMKARRIVAEKARIEADGILAKWGKSQGKKAKENEEREDAIRKNVIAELAKMKPEQVAELLKRVA